MSTETNRALVERLDAILNTGDLGQLDELCSRDMVNHSLAPSRPPGLEGTRQWLATEGRKFGSFRWRELFVVAERDLVVQSGVRGGHWPGGAFRGFDMPPGPTTETPRSCTGSPGTASWNAGPSTITWPCSCSSARSPTPPQPPAVTNAECRLQ